MKTKQNLLKQNTNKTNTETNTTTTPTTTTNKQKQLVTVSNRNEAWLASYREEVHRPLLFIRLCVLAFLGNVDGRDCRYNTYVIAAQATQ